MSLDDELAVEVQDGQVTVFRPSWENGKLTAVWFALTVEEAEFLSAQLALAAADCRREAEGAAKSADPPAPAAAPSHLSLVES